MERDGRVRVCGMRPAPNDVLCNDDSLFFFFFFWCVHTAVGGAMRWWYPWQGRLGLCTTTGG